MIATRVVTLATLLLVALAGACASTPAATTAADATATAAATAPAQGCMMPETCPMQVEGTTVTAADVDGGASLVFVTTGDVAALRERVTKMAAMHAGHAEGGKMGGGMHHGMKMGGGMHHGMKMGEGAMTPMPPATAAAAETEGGATLTLTATDPATVDALREHVRARAAHMQSGACAMKPAA